MRLLRYGGDKRARRAFEERQALVKAGLTRRDLVKMGILTGGGIGGGLVMADRRSSTALGALPPLTPFVEPLTVLPALPSRSASELGTGTTAPTSSPYRAINPANNMHYEGRSEAHQSRDSYPVAQYLMTRMAANPNVSIHPNLPSQTFWGFNQGGADLTADPAMSPGPVLVMRYGSPVLIRRYNALPPPEQNGGFGVPDVSTHLHNFHSGPESDGAPCDPTQQRFFYRGQYYDYYHNLCRAGWNSTHPGDGNIQESLGFLWYHYHRVDHTAENTYKGLVGPAIVFNEFDTGDETTGFRLPSFPDYDIPLVLADRLFNPTTGLLAFDTFNTDGVLGNVFLVNGKAQPFFEVRKRRYRFRVLDAGPSRFYEIYLTNPDNLAQRIPFWVIANDGNLLPRPVEVTSHRLGVAERVDIIVDFAKIAQRFGNPARIRLENRLEQTDGRGPTGNILAAGHGNQLVEFQLIGGAVTDESMDPEPVAFPRVPATAGDAVFAPISLPDITQLTPRITRRFRFERGDGGWQLNARFIDCTRFRFSPQANSAEKWVFVNDSGGWQHPIHIHLEEFRILSRNGRAIRPGAVEYARKDVVQLGFGEQIEVLTRFRDFRGGYPLHCHNTVHEDHQMMLLWNVSDSGDTRTQP